jgi:hypothetical protein
VVLNEEYVIASPLDLTFLESVDVAITGTIKFTNDIDFWVVNSFKYDFQNSSAFWRFGGKDVNIYGGGHGLIDGNGQAWYDRFAVEPTLLRPILLVLDGLDRGSVTGLKMRNSPDAGISSPIHLESLLMWFSGLISLPIAVTFWSAISTSQSRVRARIRPRMAMDGTLFEAIQSLYKIPT